MDEALVQWESDRLFSVVPVDVALYDKGEYALHTQEGIRVGRNLKKSGYALFDHTA